MCLKSGKHIHHQFQIHMYREMVSIINFTRVSLLLLFIKFIQCDLKVCFTHYTYITLSYAL